MVMYVIISSIHVVVFVVLIYNNKSSNPKTEIYIVTINK